MLWFYISIVSWSFIVTTVFGKIKKVVRIVFLKIYAVDKIFTRPPVPAVPPNINSGWLSLDLAALYPTIPQLQLCMYFKGDQLGIISGQQISSTIFVRHPLKVVWNIECVVHTLYQQFTANPLRWHLYQLQAGVVFAPGTSNNQVKGKDDDEA